MKKILSIFLISTVAGVSYGQQSILSNDLAQGEKLIEAYFTPMAESFGTGLNIGWYNTAKPHSILGFDVTFTLNTVIIPNSAETLNIGDKFEGIFTSQQDDASTIFGSSSSTEMIYNSSVNTSTNFNMPGGLKTPAIPLPMLQAGIGLMKKTSIDIRYMPMLNVGDNINVYLFGYSL